MSPGLGQCLHRNFKNLWSHKPKRMSMEESRYIRYLDTHGPAFQATKRKICQKLGPHATLNEPDIDSSQSSKLWMLSFSIFDTTLTLFNVFNSNPSCLSFLYSCTKCTKCRYVASLGQLFLQKPWVGQGKLAWTLPKLRLLTLEPLTHASPNLNWKESNVEYRNCTDQTSKIRWGGKSSVAFVLAQTESNLLMLLAKPITSFTSLTTPNQLEKWHSCRTFLWVNSGLRTLQVQSLSGCWLGSPNSFPVF